MRPDMGKVITERPRRGPRLKGPAGEGKAKAAATHEDAPNRESIRRKWQSGWNGKEFTDVIGPIRGFLKSRCGRRWDDVLAEISAALPATGGISYRHAREHLFQMVEEKTQLIDGQLCDAKGFELGSYVDFYVCPKGFLRQTKAPRRKYRPRKPQVFKRTDAGEWLIQDAAGVWFACFMADYKECGREPHENERMRQHGFTRPRFPVVFDALQKTIVSDPYYPAKWYGRWVYCVSKRSIGKREIKKYGLR